MSEPRTLYVVAVVQPWSAARVRDSLGREKPLAAPCDGSTGFLQAFDTRAAAEAVSGGHPVIEVLEVPRG